MSDGAAGRVLVLGDVFVDVVAGGLPGLPVWGGDVAAPGPILALPGGSAQVPR